MSVEQNKNVKKVAYANEKILFEMQQLRSLLLAINQAVSEGSANGEV